jgi:hypothetical protein
MDTDTAVQKVNLKMRNPMEKNDSWRMIEVPEKSK